MPQKSIHTKIGNQKLTITNPSKVLYPTSKITKAACIQYIMKVMKPMLTLVKDRPMTFIRFPDGIGGKSFYSKNAPSWTPDWLPTTTIFDDEENHYLMLHNEASLVFAMNLAALEWHPGNIQLPNLDKPNQIIFDLDPSPEFGFGQLKEVAIDLKAHLESYGYHPFVKTSGSSGLHIYCPIIAQYDIEVINQVVDDLGNSFVAKYPKTTTLTIKKEKRKNKVLIDIYRNRKAQTCVAPYSLRAKEGAPISMPFEWKYIQEIETSRMVNLQNFDSYFSKFGEAWKDFYIQATPIHLEKERTAKEIKTAIKNTDVSSYISPMLASMGDTSILSSDQYFFEVKWDGIRAIFVISGGKTKIFSRSGNDITDKFGEFARFHECFQAKFAIIDAEIVSLDDDGKPKFSDVVGRIHQQKEIISNRVVSYVFDVLNIDGQDLRPLGNKVRRTKLLGIMSESAQVKISGSFSDGASLYKAIEAQNMEGVMAKAFDKPYVSGQRTDYWLKVKCRYEDEAYIIGYTKGEGDRSSTFGALHLAKKEGEEYIYVGKVGTGFDYNTIQKIYEKLIQLETTKKPIKEKIEEPRRTVWVTPRYVAKITYASMTNNGTYREPVFVGVLNN